MEAVTVIHRTGFGGAIIESPAVLIQIAEQMKWFDANVGASQLALQEAPEILQPVSMDLPIHVFLCVIDYTIQAKN